MPVVTLGELVVCRCRAKMTSTSLIVMESPDYSLPVRFFGRLPHCLWLLGGGDVMEHTISQAVCQTLLAEVTFCLFGQALVSHLRNMLGVAACFLVQADGIIGLSLRDDKDNTIENAKEQDTTTNTPKEYNN